MSTAAQPSNFEIRVVDESAMPSALDMAIRDLLCGCFPADVGYFRHQRGWNGSHPVFSVVTMHADRLVGHVSVVWRSVSVGGNAVLVGGVQNVSIAKDFRGRGLLAPMLRMAMDETRSRGAPFGLLFCGPGVEPSYQRCGWSQVTPRRTIARDSAGAAVEIQLKNRVMAIALEGRPFPDGDIELNGPDW